MYVDDCVEGIYRITESDVSDPLNLGMDVMVTVDELVDTVSEIAGKSLVKKHDISKPQGVRGRNSDNSKLQNVLDWTPEHSLADGLSVTYHWIESELREAGRISSH
jgi:nucleoside-diphosphate-sugar epimerase